jgi:DNA-binding Lrp family transcriptional regulator
MSIKALVLVETTVDKVTEVTAALMKLDEVTSSDAVAGPYDVIAIVEANDFTVIGHVVTAKIQAISGISRTIVCDTR